MMFAFVNKRLRRWLCMVLVVTLLAGVCPAAFAAQEYVTAQWYVFDENMNHHDLALVKSGSLWYASAEDLSAIIGGTTRISWSDLWIYSASGTLLAQIPGYQQIQAGGRTYVLLEIAARQMGLFFYSDDGVSRVEKLCTNDEFLDRLDDIFEASHYDLTNIMTDAGASWGLAERLAWSYEVLSSFSVEAWIKAFTGSMEQDLYDKAFATIFATGGSMEAVITGVSEINSIVRKGKDLTEQIHKLLQNENTAKVLRDMGLNEDTLRWMLAGSNEEDLLEAYCGAIDFVKLDAFLETITIYCMAADTEAIMLRSAEKAFAASTNKYARSTVNRMLSARFGEGYLAVGDYCYAILEGLVLDYSSEMLDESLFGAKGKIISSAVTTAADYGVQMGDKVNATIMIPVYAAIQDDLATCFQQQRHSGNTEQLQSLAAMYLKSAIAAYENLKFDKGLEETVTKALDTLTAEMTHVLQYVDPGMVDNSAFLDYLDITLDGGLKNSAPAAPAAEDAQLVLDLTLYGQRGTVIELPRIYGSSSEAAQQFNAVMTQWFEDLAYQYEYHSNGSEWCEVKSQLYTSSRYLSVVTISNVYPTFGTDGYANTWVYDKQTCQMVTVEQALMETGKTKFTLEGDFLAFLASEGYTSNGMSGLGFFYNSQGQVCFIASLTGENPATPPWDYLLIWENGVCRHIY